MTARLLLLLAMLLGIAFAPVKPVAGCAVVAAPTCERCCPSAGQACCVAANAPAPLVPAGIAADDGKQLVAPTLFFLCLRPIPATEPPAVQRLHAARRPAPPLLDLLCVRLV